MFLHFLNCILPQFWKMVPYLTLSLLETGKRRQDETEHTANQGLRRLVDSQRNTRTNQEASPLLPDLMFSNSSDLCTCVSFTWLVQRIACLQTFVFLPSLKLTFVLIFSYWTSILAWLKRFTILLKRIQKCFSNCCFVSHSVVGGHIMVCMAQPLELLVRTYKRLSSFEHETFY